MKNKSQLCRARFFVTFAILLLSLCNSSAQTWTNFTGNLRWATTINWSPNIVPNADGAVVNFQVDVPSATAIGVVSGTGGNFSALLTTLKLGDTNGAQALTINKGNPAASTSRLHFTNSVGSTLIEKRGDGNDVIDVGSMRTYNNNLNVVFAGGIGTLTFNCDIAQQAPFVTLLNVSGPGTLIVSGAANTHTGGTIINEATVQVANENRLGGVPAGLEPANITVGNNGTLRANGNVTVNGNRGFLLKGGGTATFSTVTNTQTLAISGPISSDGGSPSSFVAAGPGIISLLGANTYAGPTLVSGGTLSMVAANYTGGGALSVSDATALTLNASSNGKLDVSSATLGSSGDVTLNLDYGSAGGVNPFNPALNVAGSFNPAAANIFIKISGSNFVAGQFPLIDYTGSPLGSIANFSLGSLPPGVVATLVHNTGNTSIDLNISLAVNALTWFGGVSDQWELGGALNWNSGATNYNEYGVNGDVVTFDDTLDGVNSRTNINLTTTLRPTIVNVANGSFEYIFSGAGKLSGATIFNKSGIQALTINTANEHTGTNTITQGRVRIGHNTALGSGTIVFAGGNISSDSVTDRALSNPVRFSAAGGVFTQFGDPANTGKFTFSGPMDFANAARDFFLYNDMTFSGTVTNGGLDQKQGPGAWRFQNVIGTMANGQIQIEEGSVIVDGGVINKTGGGIRVACLLPGGTSYFSVTNGAVVTMSASAGNLRLGSLTSPTSEPSANNIVDIAGSLIWGTNNISGNILMGGSCTLAQLNLKPGGFIRPPAFVHEGNTTELNFEGGTLAPLGNHATFLQGLTAANVRSGGAVIDTEGKTITIAQPLLNGGGGGGLTKNGLGKLTLTGANTYTGTTIANGGQLYMTPDHLGGGAISATSGGAFGVKLVSAGTSLNGSTATFASGSAVEFDLGALGNPTVAPLNVTTLVANGTVTVNIPLGNLSVGVFPLIDYTGGIGGSGFSAFTIGNLPLGVIATLVNNAGNSSVDLNVTALAPVLWEGDINGDWDIGLTANWSVNASSTPYQEFAIPGPSVTLDDSASGTRSVNITTNVSPASVTVSNTSPAYSFSGSGKISGPSSLTKQGSGTLTVATSNDYSGATIVGAGKLVLGASGVIPDGAGKGELTVNGTFDLAGFNEAVNGLSGSGVVDNSTGSSALTLRTNALPTIFSGNIVNSGGTLGLSKTGSGEITLSGNNTYSGGTAIFAGGVRIGSSSALGSGGVTLSEGTLSSDSTTARTINNNFLIVATSTFGNTTNTGLLTINGNIDFAAAARNLTFNSDAIFTGTLTNGRPNKLGTSTLTLTGSSDFNGGSEVRNGMLIVDGGAITSTDSFRPDCDVAGTARMVITNGATVTLTGTTVNGRVGYTGGDATMTNILDLSGTWRMPNADSGNGTFTVGRNGVQSFFNFYSGADLATRQISKSTTGTGQYAELNFNGGILRAMNNQAVFITGLDLATIRNGGVTIDSDAFAITIAQPLLTDGGTGGLTKIGSGTLLLNGVNTYTGTTFVNVGTLGGTGTIAGPVSVASGATLSPGASIGVLTINNTVRLQGTTLMEINPDSGPLSDLVQGVTTQTNGGTLTVTNIGITTPTSGQVFNLFDATTFTGSFSAINLPPLELGLAWNTNNLAVDGTISVVTSTAGPQFNQPILSGNTLSFSGSGGTPSGIYHVLTSTNVALPVANWTPIATNNFDGSGNFNFTDTIISAPQRFYLISTP